MPVMRCAICFWIQLNYSEGLWSICIVKKEEFDRSVLEHAVKAAMYLDCPLRVIGVTVKRDASRQNQ